MGNNSCYQGPSNLNLSSTSSSSSSTRKTHIKFLCRTLFPTSLVLPTPIVRPNQISIQILIFSMSCENTQHKDQIKRMKELRRKRISFSDSFLIRFERRQTFDFILFFSLAPLQPISYSRLLVSSFLREQSLDRYSKIFQNNGITPLGCLKGENISQISRFRGLGHKLEENRKLDRPHPHP